MKKTNMKKTKRIECVIDENGCWICISHSRNSRGYPRITIRGRHSLISREILRAKNKLPFGGYALHSCDTPACINPRHLFGSYQVENMLDCERKKRRRHVSGEDFWGTKLSEEQVKEVRRVWEKSKPKYGEKGKLLEDLGKRMGVREATLRNVVYNQSWHTAISAQ